MAQGIHFCRLEPELSSTSDFNFSLIKENTTGLFWVLEALGHSEARGTTISSNENDSCKVLLSTHLLERWLFIIPESHSPRTALLTHFTKNEFQTYCFFSLPEMVSSEWLHKAGVNVHKVILTFIYGSCVVLTNNWQRLFPRLLRQVTWHKYLV